ncbi:MAG: nitroreductase family protein [Deltaproteobacteria bacterium]|nr:nitroreductase family protein [Deltaproteobacteria bacterium]
MHVIDAIKNRRSIRQFRAKPVPEELILELLEAANLAPSATNRQPWEFVVVQRSYLDRLQHVFEQAMKDRVAEIGEKELGDAIKDLSIPTHQGMDKVKGLEYFSRTLGGAPLAVVFCIPVVQDPWEWRNSISSTAAAIENFLLAATSKDLGTCWLTGPLKTRAKAISSILQIPRDKEIVAIVAVGFPRLTPKMPPKKELKNKLTWLGFD